MRTNNVNVANLWAKSKSAKSYNAQLSTDGRYLYSYDLVIGWTKPNGDKVAILYNAPNGAFESVTTSTHVRYAINASDYAELPVGHRLTKQSVKRLKAE